METVSILIADDHAVIRRGLRVLLETQANWKVVAEENNGRAAVERAIKLRPDVAILDISMPDLNGLDATALILRARPETRILILTMHSNEEIIKKALIAGARGYLLKSDAERDLITAVECVLRGKTFFTSAASDMIMESLRGDDRSRWSEEKRGQRLMYESERSCSCWRRGAATKKLPPH